MLVVSQLSSAASFNDAPMIVASVVACVAMFALILFKKEAKNVA